MEQSGQCDRGFDDWSVLQLIPYIGLRKTHRRWIAGHVQPSRRARSIFTAPVSAGIQSAMADMDATGPGKPPLLPTSASASAPTPARPALVLRLPSKPNPKPNPKAKHERLPGDKSEASGREESSPLPASIGGIKTSSPALSSPPPPSSSSSSSTRRGPPRKISKISNPDPLNRKPEFGLTDIELVNILPPMAARNRPRGPPQRDDAADAHEERNMWNQIQTDLGRLKIINAKAKEVADQIIKMEAEMGSCT